MRHPALLMTSLLAAAALLAAGCASDPAISDGLPLADDAPIPVEPDGGIGTDPNAPIPVEPDGGIGTDPDAPMPVEGDGGIGGDPGDGTVTSNLILDGDQVEVVGTCLEPDTGSDSVYRMDLADGALWLYRTGAGDRFEYAAHGGPTLVSPDDQPPTVDASPGAVTAQGLVAGEDGADERFVDAVFGTDDLPECTPLR